MIKTLKNHVCLCALTTSVFFFMPNISAGAQDSKPSCNSLFKSYPCDALGTIKSASESLSNVAYVSGDTSVKIINKRIVKVGEKENLGVYGILQLKKTGEIASEVFAQKNMEIFFNDVSVTGRGKKIGSRNNDIKQSVFGVKQGGTLLVLNGKVDVTDVHGLVMESSTGVFIPGGESLYGVLDGKRLYGSWDWRYSKVVFENSDITVKGRGARGMYFQGNSLQEDYEEGEALVQLGELEFKKTAFKVPDGTAIYIDDSKRYPYITASEGARIFADRLLEVKNHSYVVVNADASFLVGGTRIDTNSYAEIELSNKSKWTLTPGKNNKWRDSSVSFVRNIDSSIFFQKPKNGRYQTLHIGADDLVSDYAYVAKNARLIVNASLTTDGQNKGIKADKVLIYGDVYGNTKVHVVEIPVNSRKGKSLSQDDKKSSHSVSVIQVYGEAAEDSFKLAAGYVALRGAPYRYRLRAYGPTSSLGNAKNENMLAKQKSSKSNGGFWDFRLETEYVQSSSQLKTSQLRKNSSRFRVSRSIGSSADRNYVVADAEGFIFYPGTGIKAVVPQVPTYLLLPNALFHASLMDISNKNKQLEISQTAVGNFLENSENPAFFVRSYGGNSRYVSDLSDLEYGYGGNLGYHAVEAGVSLKAMKSADCSTGFGIMGTYGKISLQPQDVVESKKSAFDKWLVTAYGSIQHDTGFYLNGLFSYGLFKGDVLTLVRGKTAELKGNALSASLSVGKSFMTGYEGFVFDPQAQVVYQNLQFDKASDIDGFDIEMGKPNQWVMRVGGRLSKALAVSQTGSVVSFNGKLHFTHCFGEKQFVHFGDKFQLGAFGSSLEAGLGFNAQLSSKFALLGDVTYQHKLSKAGFSGARFSGGLRYHF
ncbi:autotransporter outer membrane beta-barrel domain-containing protein [Bartonella sp. MM73XJBT]|uniref:autotransporter outer membrane beta-barrel domain-containing protein n=1 Tax=Bartonella sp. MM73XJBT TaxID=3019095 RepID=UPI00236119EF|nr:autotransporter outer membrane beta-barrel domain-containing protein [Bartonella sp. MM73XJBT]